MPGSKFNRMIDKAFLRESMRSFRGPGHDPKKRDHFVEEIKEWDSALVFPVLVDLFTDPDLDIRANSMEAALLIDKELGLDAVVPLLNHPDWDIRYHICGLMNVFGDQRAIEPLLEILKNDPDSQVRGAAAFGLQGIGHVISIPDLVESADNDNGIDRLGYAPSQSARQAISEILAEQVIKHIVTNPNVEIGQSYSFGGYLTGKIIYLSNPMHSDRRFQNLPRNTFEYTQSRYIRAESLHPFPFLVDITYRSGAIEVKRKYVFSFANGRWAIGIYLSPKRKDG